MGRLSDLALTVLMNFLSGVLSRTATALWDEMWEYIFEAVVEAENKFGSGNGAKKRDWAIGLVLDWLKENAELNFIQMFVARLIVSNLIKSLIDEFNEKMGHDWLERAKELKDMLTGKIPFVG